MPDSRSRVARPVAAAFTIALLVAGCSGDDQSSEATVAVDQSSETTAPVDQRPDVTTPASPATTEAPAPVTDAAPSVTAEGEASPSTAPTRTDAPTPTVLATVPEQDSVFAVVQARDDLSKFAELLVAIDAPAVFQQARGLTLLAPNDAAWDAYGAEAFQALLDDPTAAILNRSSLRAVSPTRWLARFPSPRPPARSQSAEPRSWKATSARRTARCT
jgi:hypothetical protein